MSNTALGALPVSMRPSLTPGRLYAMMSVEFQEARSRHCIGCIMPMLTHLDGSREDDGANWELEPMGHRCKACEASVERIFAKYAALYDVKDHSAAP